MRQKWYFYLKEEKKRKRPANFKKRRISRRIKMRKEQKKEEKALKRSNSYNFRFKNSDSARLKQRRDERKDFH